MNRGVIAAGAVVVVGLLLARRAQAGVSLFGQSGVTAGYRSVAPAGIGGTYTVNPYERIDLGPTIIWD